MTPTDVTLLQSSFRKITPIADQAAALFYARLFELEPDLRALFKGDMHEQGRMLMSMISAAVASLECLETLVPQIRALWARHGSYGVNEAHYASVGAALTWTLQKGLGPEFTPAVRAAWVSTYSLLASTMIDAQRSAEVAA